MGNGFYLSAPPPSPPPSNLLFTFLLPSRLSPSLPPRTASRSTRRGGGSEKEATPHENEGDRILIEVSFGILINVITGLFRVACRSVENPLPTYFLLLPCPPSLSLRQNYPRIVPFGCRMELDFLFFFFFLFSFHNNVELSTDRGESITQC